MLSNLVGNAVKYTARGHVRVSLARVDGRVRLEVADKPGVLARITVKMEVRKVELFWLLRPLLRGQCCQTGFSSAAMAPRSVEPPAVTRMPWPLAVSLWVPMSMWCHHMLWRLTHQTQTLKRMGVSTLLLRKSLCG